MSMKLTLGAAIVAVAAFLTPASAAPLAPPTSAAVAGGQGLVQQVHWRYRHRYYYYPGYYYYPRYYYYPGYYYSDDWWWYRRHRHHHHWRHHHRW
jgi:hypothetical protein